MQDLRSSRSTNDAATDPPQQPSPEARWTRAQQPYCSTACGTATGGSRHPQRDPTRERMASKAVQGASAARADSEVLCHARESGWGNDPHDPETFPLAFSRNHGKFSKRNTVFRKRTEPLFFVPVEGREKGWRRNEKALRPKPVAGQFLREKGLFSLPAERENAELPQRPKSSVYLPKQRSMSRGDITPLQYVVSRRLRR